MRTKPHNISAATKPHAAHVPKSVSVPSAPIPVRWRSKIPTPDSAVRRPLADWLLPPVFPLTPNSQLLTPIFPLTPVPSLPTPVPDLSSALTNLHPSTPTPPQLPNLLLHPISYILCTSFTQHKSPSKPTPRQVIRENPRESAVLKERTQFLTPNCILTLFITTTYINPLSPATENTNPIQPTPQPLGPPFEPNPYQTHTEPIPNPIRTPFRPATLCKCCPPLPSPPEFNSLFALKTAQFRPKTVQNAPIFAKKRFKRAQNASKMTLILPSPCANRLRFHHFAQQFPTSTRHNIQ